MSAGSTFASQQKALRRQFAYSDDYPLAMMIKELNTQILSRVGTGTLSEQLEPAAAANAAAAEEAGEA